MSQAQLENVPSNNSINAHSNGHSTNGHSTNGHRATASAPVWRVAPQCDLYESDGEYLLVIDMPGASTDSLQLELTGNELAIRARRAPSSQGADVATTSFERHIELPADVDGNSTSAQLQGGVLRVKIAKAASARRVKIPVAIN